MAIVIDIILIIFLAAFIFIGFKKGLLLSLLSLINSFVSIIAAFFLAKPVAWLLEKAFGLTTALTGHFAGSLATSNPAMIESLTEAVSASSMLNDIEMNGFIRTILKFIMGDDVLQAGTIPAEYFGNMIAGIVALIIGFITAFIVIRIIIALLSKLFNRLKKNRLFNATDRIFGIVFGAAKGILIMMLCFIVLGFVKFIPPAKEPIETTVEQTYITKHCENLTTKTVEFVINKINIKDIIKSITK